MDIIYSENEENIITTEVLDDINRDFQTFITQKDAIISFCKENQRKLITQVENLSFISLKNTCRQSTHLLEKQDMFVNYVTIIPPPVKRAYPPIREAVGRQIH